MSDPILIQTKTALPIDQIAVTNRLRPVSAAGVATIVASIREIGQLANPVVVRQMRRKGETIWCVLDGAHRLAAAVEMGWAEVPVRVFECTDDQARIMEIDGNLSGAELNPLTLSTLSALTLLVLVSITGAIGFVGLVVPHAARFLVGSRHVRLVPVSALIGMVFLIAADVIARMLVPGQTLPIGVVTALVGAPAFAIILIRARSTP